MTKHPRNLPVPGSGLHHTQVKRAFMDDSDHPARLGRLIAADGATLTVQYLDDGATGSVEVTEPVRLAEITDRTDLCRLGGLPLLLVSERYRVIGIATGPATPPARLEVFIVSRLENGSAVELINDSQSQPGWQLLALKPR